ncbi:MAG: PspC domain-containing protein [Candidatus Cryptobacteroides sp.]
MKKTVSAAIGGRNFIIDEDAYNSLSNYLDSFKEGLGSSDKTEVMDELEMRIADLFTEKLKGREVVSIALAEEVIAQLGMPNWNSENMNGNYNNRDMNRDFDNTNAPKRFYRDEEHRMIGGVCSGLAIYFNIDVVLVRVLFAVALLMGTAGFWVYIVFWIIAPEARTASEKCELRGIPATAENIRRFSSNR